MIAPTKKWNRSPPPWGLISECTLDDEERRRLAELESEFGLIEHRNVNDTVYQTRTRSRQQVTKHVLRLTVSIAGYLTPIAAMGTSLSHAIDRLEAVLQTVRL